MQDFFFISGLALSWVDSLHSHTSAEEKPSKEAEEIQQLKIQNLVLQDREALQNEGYFRQQVLIMLERIAKSLEASLESSEEEPKNE